MKKYSLFIASIISITSIAFTFSTSNVSALKVNESCSKVEILFARGSGQNISADGSEARYFFQQIGDRISKSSLTFHQYELGLESYGGSQYPAVDVGGWNIFTTSLGASLSSGYFFKYGESVNSGVTELKSYLEQRYNKCKFSKTRYILGGYSQGAQVVGQTLPKLSSEIKNDIIFVGLFGDPKLHYPEGEGWNPPACQGKRLSPWRRAATNCNLDNGSLSARIPYLPDDMKYKTGLWCYEYDMICDAASLPSMGGHATYKTPGRAIDEAAWEATWRLRERLKEDSPSSPLPPIFGQTLPAPKPAYEMLNVTRSFGMRTTGQNVVFLVDISDYMRPYLPTIQDFINRKGKDVVSRGGSYTVSLYHGVVRAAPGAFSSYNVTTSNLITQFNSSDQYNLSYRPPYIGPYPPPVYPGSTLKATDDIYNSLNWQKDATKSLIIFTNNPFLNAPDPQGTTLSQIVRRSLAIDPVNIYPVVPEESATSYEQLAKDTAGQVITFTDANNIAAAADRAYVKTVERPVALLKNTKYSAGLGQEITFDASDSYVIDASIVKYEWDFNGDGAFEQTTATPSVNHTYLEQFDGLMQVRITASNDTVANMSATVKIADVTPPILPEAPKNLSYSIKGTVDNKSTATISWQADPDVKKWLLRIDDIPAGYIEGNRTSIDLSDIDRSKDVVISIAGATNDLESGSYSDVTIPLVVSPPNQPQTSTCSYPNFFQQLFCQATALLKFYLNGIWYYIHL